MGQVTAQPTSGSSTSKASRSDGTLDGKRDPLKSVRVVVPAAENEHDEPEQDFCSPLNARRNDRFGTLSPDETDLEFEFPMNRGTTPSSLLEAVRDLCRKEHPSRPHIIGLKVIREDLANKGSESSASSRRSTALEPRDAELQADTLVMGGAGLVVNYEQSVEDALGGATAFEAVLEIKGDLARKSSSSSPATPGTSRRRGFEDYKIVRTLFRGPASRVYQAQHKDGVAVAVKVMSKDYHLQKQRRLVRVVREKRILSKLQHPFVVRLEWAFQTRSHFFMVLDLCSGGDLEFHLAKRGRFTEVDSRFYFSEILLGLEYLQAQGVLHRDLKPQNCLLDQEGHIRLTDFGISRDNVTDSACFTSLVGTPGYIAPELALHKGHAKPADFYCLGCLLHALFTGRPPPIPDFPQDISDIARDLLIKFLEPNPELRLVSFVKAKDHKWLDQVDFLKVHRRERQECFPNFPPVKPDEDISKNFWDLNQNQANADFRRLAEEAPRHPYVEDWPIVQSGIFESGSFAAVQTS